MRTGGATRSLKPKRAYSPSASPVSRRQLSSRCVAPVDSLAHERDAEAAAAVGGVT